MVVVTVVVVVINVANCVCIFFLVVVFESPLYSLHSQRISSFKSG